MKKKKGSKDAWKEERKSCTRSGRMQKPTKATQINLQWQISLQQAHVTQAYPPSEPLLVLLIKFFKLILAENNERCCVFEVHQCTHHSYKLDRNMLPCLITSF